MVTVPPRQPTWFGTRPWSAGVTRSCCWGRRAPSSGSLVSSWVRAQRTHAFAGRGADAAAGVAVRAAVVGGVPAIGIFFTGARRAPSPCQCQAACPMPKCPSPPACRGSALTAIHLLPLAGLSASGKSTVACTLEHMLNAHGHYTVLLDGDNIRHGLNKDLGFRWAAAAQGASFGCCRVGGLHTNLGLQTTRCRAGWEWLRQEARGYCCVT